MQFVEFILSALLIAYTLSPLIRMNVKLALVYLAVLVFTGFFGLVSPEALRIIGAFNKDNIAAILVVFSFFIFIFDGRAMYVVKNRILNSEFNLLFTYMWLFVGVSILSLVMTILNDYGVVFSFKVAFNFIQYFLLLLLYLIFLSLSEEKFHWFIGVLEKMVFLNMVIYVLNNFGVSLLGADNYQELAYGLSRNFEGFPQLLPFFFCLAYSRFRENINIWNSSYVFLAILTVIFTFTRSWIIALLLVVIFMEVFVIRNMNIKAITQMVIALVASSVALLVFFPNELSVLSERFMPTIGATSIDEVQNISIRWLMFQERLELLFDHPFIGVGFINPYDPSNNYRFSAGLSVITGDIFWPNLFVTTGLIGTACFFLLQFETFKQTFKWLDTPVVSSTIGMLIFLLTSAFFSGNTFLNNAFAYLLVLSLGLASIRFRASNKKEYLI